jgi:hypothetical protein
MLSSFFGSNLDVLSRFFHVFSVKAVRRLVYHDSSPFSPGWEVGRGWEGAKCANRRLNFVWDLWRKKPQRTIKTHINMLDVSNDLSLKLRTGIALASS